MKGENTCGPLRVITFTSDNTTYFSETPLLKHKELQWVVNTDWRYELYYAVIVVTVLLDTITFASKRKLILVYCPPSAHLKE